MPVYDLTPKENYLRVIRDHKAPEYTPVYMDASALVANQSWIEKGDMRSKPDPFGVLWTIDQNALGPIPVPGRFILNDITKWESTVTIPDVDEFDWAKWAEEDLAMVPRDLVAIDYNSTVGPYERLASLMGFEGALIAMAMEPDATFALLEAITDFKLKVLEKAARYYKPDSFTIFDDVATARAPFMSPEMYEKLIMPCHQRIYAACKEYGILSNKHCCGKWDQLIDQFTQEGFDAISSVQSQNDIVPIMEKYGERFCIIGGFNSTGEPGYTTDANVMAKERERCAWEYGRYDSYVYWGMSMGLMKNKDDEGNVLPFELQLASMMELTRDDAEYFRRLGAPKDRLTVMGQPA